MKFTRTSDAYLKDVCQINYIKLDEVIMKDSLKDIKKKKIMYLIINLQSSQIGNGTHWVALVKKNSNYFYFDSFGVAPPLQITQYKNKNHKCGYNSFIVQDLKSEACGFYCIAFLHYMQNTTGNDYENYNDFINIFNDNTKTNDKQLGKYINFAKIKL